MSEFMIENDYEFSCPYCGEKLSIRVDLTGGEHQSFVYDCEICCRPIQIELELEDSEVLNFSAGPAD